MKRAVAILTIILLTALPILSAIPVYAAPGVTVNLSQSSGPTGASVTVIGTISSTGAHFTVFWGFIRDWDGRYGKIAEGWATGNNYQLK